MKTFLLLAVVALAVTALPQHEGLPGHDSLPAYPPVTVVEAPETTFTEEAAFDEEGSFSAAQELIEKKGTSACKDLADTTINDVKANIKQEQDILNKLDDGSKCAQEGQGAITAAKKAVKEAESKKKSADKALTDAKAAKVNFGDFTFSALNPNNCATFFGSTAYTSAKAKVDSASQAASKASGEVAGAKTSVKGAEDAAVEAVKQCKCATFQAHEKALKAANSKVESANKAAWTKGYHLKCVLAGTSPGSCSVPAMPKVAAAKLAAGVDASACGPQTHHGGASFPLATGKGTWPQHSTGKKDVSITGNDANGYNFVIQDKNFDTWHRGAFAHWKIEQSDLPVALSFDWAIPSSNIGSKGLAFIGFDYVANNKHNAWYDCNGDFFLRMQPKDTPHEYTVTSKHNWAGCTSANLGGTSGIATGKCKKGLTSGKYEIKISAAGKVTYYQDGALCGTSANTAKDFPMYVQSSQYGGQATLKNIKLTTG